MDIAEHGTPSTERWPTDLVVSADRRMLTVIFDDGTRHELSAEYLRVESPSAEVQGHAARERRIVGGKREVRILSVDPVGHYAVRIGFDDGHGSGIYSWGYLDALGREHGTRWTAYEEALAARGLDRDRPGSI